MTARGPTSFEQRVDKWVLAAVDSRASFDELVCQLPGVYPPIVAASLDRLRRQGALSDVDCCRAMSRSPIVGRRHRGPVMQMLPVPHPLDFDWRYGKEAVERLLDLAIRKSQPGDTIALLGTPSLYAETLRRAIDRSFVLLDANATTVQRLQVLGHRRSVLRRDLFADQVPDLGASVVIADPPWYDDHIAAFLWAAASCSSPGATVLLSLPAKGTRPGVHRERKAFRASAAAQSLTPLRTVAGLLPYVSPPFEINALRAAGWEHLPTEWRRGDLAMLRSAAKPGTRPERPTTEHRWDERALGPARIRVRRGSRDTGIDPTLASVVEGDVLGDVSRRHPLRDRPNVWTTGNRIYLSAAPHTLLTVLDAVQMGSDPAVHVASTIGRELTRTEETSISRTANQLRWIGRIEGRELARHGWGPHPQLVDRSAS